MDAGTASRATRPPSRGELRDGDELVQRIRDFYTADRMDVIEMVAPGWRAMSAYADGATRNHVTQALIALQLLPEYRQAPRHLQALLEWSELFHEILQGLERLFGAGSAAEFIVRAVLLHQSLNVVPEWPNAGSLTEAELACCIRLALLPFRQGTLSVFANVRQLVVC